ncbi:aminotransferase class I/II-fold pyridoxal phosphate-dependent enzyme [Lichenicola cladoniae]|uniref:Aminotransferase n=1 Tax=Lichenicola cladoniae TaxID=1484109 RepID=A0A6M8HRS0_9PROT|nr:aminotransferase class I/II-fold pyridoxal phosphate-dependent enzyme [Lichenicola cladoniae]NPD65808.1 aminotransferase class I/II-fold pyridoxal phosphate-dependent enzyme [Acetobacteraceae bacterium]QKE91183.1 aminotransferase class I/II-fold pyridoxal phosphate-dependent enzyme [Lichenicola cladoniae]
MLKTGAGASLQPFLAMEVVRAANARQAALGPGDPRIIRLEVGQPATGAPALAIEAVQRALTSGLPLGYTEASGLASLRGRIARHYRDFYGTTVLPERITITTGASGGFLLAFLAAFDPGDRIALASPYYPPYVNILHALGMQPVVLPTDASSRFQPTVALLQAMAETGQGLPDGLIVASPCNPAGTTLDDGELAVLARFCHANGIRLISDEIYHGLNWEAPPATAAAYSDSAIVINSFSKYWSMTGWRVGWTVLPQDLLKPVLRLKQNLFISAPHISQIAAEAAFEATSEVAANMDRYRRSRAHLLANLPAAGFTDIAPAQGAFYIYAGIGDRSYDSIEFCARLLAGIGVAATPGVDFDAVRGHRTIRFSYCGPEADMIEAADRLAAYRDS